jgi:phosphopantothenoylcysteine decarboxylase/phosphopantothenate--cysteine ligase
MKDLAGRHLVLGLTGGIACYKSAELCRLLVKAGATVQVVMTDAATQFITPVTMQALSQRPVVLSQWDARFDNHMPHIDLSREADAVVLAPCSADFLARLAQGRADEVLSLLCLARPAERVGLWIAPAMNREMWHHPATQRNLRQVQADGAVVFGVGQGEQACGESGDGRMLEPAELLADIVAGFQPKLLAGRKVLITAGPTFEAIDPVRGVTNLSSGKMGFALARAAREAGADVTLVAGPVALPTPRGVRRVAVVSAQNMLEAVINRAQDAHIFIATAAVADWRPSQAAVHKIKKAGDGRPPALSFVENPDVLAEVAHSSRAQSGQLFCVGFAAESENLLENGRAKRLRKGVPLLVANLGPATFGQDDNALLLIDDAGETQTERMDKLQLARLLVAVIADKTSAIA